MSASFEHVAAASAEIKEIAKRVCSAGVVLETNKRIILKVSTELQAKQIMRALVRKAFFCQAKKGLRTENHYLQVGL